MKSLKLFMFLVFVALSQNVFSADFAVGPAETYKTMGECLSHQSAVVDAHYALAGIPSPLLPIIIVRNNCEAKTLIWCNPLTTNCATTLGTFFTAGCNQGNTCAGDINAASAVKLDSVQGFRNEPTKVCGSVIDYVKKTFVEIVDVKSPDFYLTYSSEFNSNIGRNSNFFHELNLDDTFGVLYLVQLADAAGNSVHRFTVTNLGGVTVSWPWDQVTGNTSTNSIISRGNFTVKVSKVLSTSGTGVPDVLTKQFDSVTNTITSQATLPADSYEFNSYDVYTASKELVVYHPEVWGLGGWTLSNHHYFDRKSKTLYSGTGEKIKFDKFKTITLSPYGSVDLVSSHFLNEVYVFDQDGVHLETRTKILGVTKYKFEYATGTTRLVGFTDINNKHTEINYDGSNHISEIKLSNGIDSQFVTSGGLPTEISQGGLNKHLIAYHSTSKLIDTFEKPDGEITTASYDSTGFLTSETKNSNANQFFDEVYSSLIKTFTKTTNEGNSFATLFSGDATTTVVTNLDGNNNEISSTVYSGSSKSVTSGTDVLNYSKYSDEIWEDYFNENHLSSGSSLSGGGQTISLAAKDLVFTTYTSLADPFTLTSVEHRQSPNATSYNQTVIDAASKTITYTTKAGHVSTANFDSAERITKVTPAYQYATELSYNADGKLSQVKKGSYYTNYTYNTNGTLASETNSDGQTTSYTYDSLGKVLQKVLPNTDTVNFEYNASGQIAKITTPSNKEHSFFYIIGQFLSNLFSPSAKETTYTYDDDKKIINITKPSSQEIDYVYYANSSLPYTVTTPTGTMTYHSFDAQSRLQSVTSIDAIKTELVWLGPTIKKQTWYDTDNSVIGDIENIFLTTELKVSQIYLNSSLLTAYGFDAYDRINEVSSADYSYANSGHTRTLTNSFGALSIDYKSIDSASGDVTTKYTTANVVDALSNAQTVHMKHTFDAFGNTAEYIQAKVRNSTSLYDDYYSLVPTYDVNNRLIQVEKLRKSYSGATEITTTELVNKYLYQAGSNNNIKQFTQASTDTSIPYKLATATYSEDDELTELCGTTDRTYTYTSDGEILTVRSAEGTTSYEYDVFGNLKKVTRPDLKVIEYKVDAFNRRVKKIVDGVTTRYYLWYDQLRLAAVLDGSKTAIIKYIYGPESATSPSYVVKNGIMYKILLDPALGSVRYVINPSTKQIVQEVEYDEYGNITKNTDPSFQQILYAGGLYDPQTKLTRFGARDYDSSIGRWTTKDPIGFKGGDTNLYAYVGGDPMSNIDPSGLKILYGDGNSRNLLQPLIEQLMRSPAGAALVNQLELSSATFTLNAVSGGPSSPGNAFRPVVPGANGTVNVDLCPNIGISTNRGLQTASPLRILAHELGHLTGMRDNGTGQMNNVNGYENPIMTPIDGLIRVSY